MTSMLLTLLLTLAWVPWGEAGVKVEETFGCATIPQGKECTFSHQQLEKMDRDAACLAKLEAAMRAMEPWLEMFVWHDLGFQLTEQRRKEISKDSDIWFSARNECWTKP